MENFTLFPEAFGSYRRDSDGDYIFNFEGKTLYFNERSIREEGGRIYVHTPSYNVVLHLHNINPNQFNETTMKQTNAQLQARLTIAEAKIAVLEGVAQPFVVLTGNEFTIELLKTESKVLCAISDSSDYNPAQLNRVAFVTGHNPSNSYPFDTTTSEYRYATPLNIDGTVRVHQAPEANQITLTGSALARHMIANGESNIRVKASDTSDEYAKTKSNTRQLLRIREGSSYPFVTNGGDWRYAVPVDSNDEPIVKVVGQAATRTIQGSELADYLIKLGLVPFQAVISDASDDHAIMRLRNGQDPRQINGHNRPQSRGSKYDTNGLSYDFAVPTNADNTVRTMAIPLDATAAVVTQKTVSLTGSDLAKHLITTGQVPFRAFVSDSDDAYAIRNENVHIVDRLSSGLYVFNTRASAYDYAVPIDDNNMPITIQLPVPTTVQRTLTGSALADHLIATGQTPFRAFMSDDSDRKAIVDGDTTDVTGMNDGGCWKYATDGCSWDYVVPVDRNDRPLTMTV